jgi:hypothetical protein
VCVVELMTSRRYSSEFVSSVSPTEATEPAMRERFATARSPAPAEDSGPLNPSERTSSRGCDRR